MDYAKWAYFCVNQIPRLFIKPLNMPLRDIYLNEFKEY